jgi:hypothetical protein
VENPPFIFLSRTIIIFNYAFTLNENNYAKAYKNASSMLHIIKFGVVILFGIIQYMIYRATGNESTKYANIILIIMLCLIVIVPIVMSVINTKKV